MHEIEQVKKRNHRAKILPTSQLCVDLAKLIDISWPARNS
jgi:hypothetical protein